jgi:N-acetylglucosamine-6-phosphate deacetylase
MLPRLDNYVQNQLGDDRLMASFIADGHHMPFSTLKNFLRSKTPARSILITDAIPAAELEAGRYQFGHQEVEVSESGRAGVPGAPHLAGSTLTLDAAVLNVARHCGVPWQEAWAMASTHPSDLVGLSPPEEVTVRVKEDCFELLHV